MGKLQGKVAVVTGAGSGMGRSTAIMFAEEGAKVLISDINAETVKETENMITTKGLNAISMKVDMAKVDEVNAMIDKAVEAFGQLDVLVNCAGIFDDALPAGDMEIDYFDRVINVDLKGPFVATKRAMPHLLKTKGSVVNIASIAGKIGGAGGAAYTSAKHGLIGLTKASAVAYGHSGVRFNAICPGAVYTGLLDRKGVEDNSNPFAGKIKAIPQGRAGEPEELASTILFFACDDSSYVTGQTLVVDGGWICQA